MTTNGLAATRAATNSRQVIGSTGLKNLGGRIQEEYLRTLQSWNLAVKVFLEMRDDPTVATLLAAIKLPLLSADFDVTPFSDSTADAVAADWLWENLTTMRQQSWRSHAADALEAIDFGFYVGEIVFEKREDGRLWLGNIEPRGQETLDRWEFDERDNMTAFVQLDPDNGARYRIPATKLVHIALNGRKGNPQGQALAHDTPIPTPDGWKVIDDLREGNKVFDEEGRIRYVVARADWEDRPCYEVKFNKGDSIIADAEHLWYVEAAKERHNHRSGKVRSTNEIAKRVQIRTIGPKPTTNYAIPRCGMLDYPVQHLPVDPYFLGYWLGNGDSTGSQINMHEKVVPELLEALEAVGWHGSVHPGGRLGGLGRRVTVAGDPDDSMKPTTSLRHLGVLYNKHIPTAYLHGSIEQRLALLAGLMDSDGSIDQYGYCEFTNTNERLFWSTVELLNSLGVNPSTNVRPTDDSRQMGYRAQFQPGFIPFRLQYKAERCKLAKWRPYHFIVSVAPVEPRRTVCIETDAPSHLYLAGKSMIPTHNSLLRSLYRPWKFLKDLENLEGIGLERNVGGMPVATLPAEPLAEQDLTDLRTALNNLRMDEEMYLIVPNGMEIKGYEGGHDITQLSAAIERKQKEILMRGFAQFLKLGMDNVGTQALVKGSQDFFALSLRSIQQELLERWNQQLVPLLFGLNPGVFAGMAGLPEITWNDPGSVDSEALLTAWQTGVNAKVLTPTREDEDHIRAVLDFPDLPEGEGEGPRDGMDLMIETAAGFPGGVLGGRGAGAVAEVP